MRTIKFRAQDIASNKWLYGDIRHRKNCVCIFEQGGNIGEQVKPDTVGQFTGLRDRKGTEIYKGDILLYNGNRRIVEWKYGTFGLSMHENGFPFQAFYELPVPIVDSTVIGNIHDNPELLKGGDNEKDNVQ